jgi:hypothetical protein
MRVAAGSRAVTVARMPAGRGVAPLADVADCQRRDGFPEPVIRGEHPVIPVPVLRDHRLGVGEPGPKRGSELRKFRGPLPEKFFHGRFLGERARPIERGRSRNMPGFLRLFSCLFCRFSTRALRCYHRRAFVTGAPA